MGTFLDQIVMRGIFKRMERQRVAELREREVAALEKIAERAVVANQPDQLKGKQG